MISLTFVFLDVFAYYMLWIWSLLWHVNFLEKYGKTSLKMVPIVFTRSVDGVFYIKVSSILLVLTQCCIVPWKWVEGKWQSIPIFWVIGCALWVFIFSSQIFSLWYILVWNNFIEAILTPYSHSNRLKWLWS